MSGFKDYLGDAVYADFDGFHVVLTTENGIMETNRICLDPDVVIALGRYTARLSEAIKAANEMMGAKKPAQHP